MCSSGKTKWPKKAQASTETYLFQDEVFQISYPRKTQILLREKAKNQERDLCSQKRVIWKKAVVRQKTAAASQMGMLRGSTLSMFSHKRFMRCFP